MSAYTQTGLRPVSQNGAIQAVCVGRLSDRTMVELGPIGVTLPSVLAVFGPPTRRQKDVAVPAAGLLAQAGRVMYLSGAKSGMFLTFGLTVVLSVGACSSPGNVAPD